MLKYVCCMKSNIFRLLSIWNEHHFKVRLLSFLLFVFILLTQYLKSIFIFMNVCKFRNKKEWWIWRTNMTKWKRTMHFVILVISHWYIYYCHNFFFFLPKDHTINIFGKISISILKCVTCLLEMTFIYTMAFILLSKFELKYCILINGKNNVIISLIFIKSVVTSINYILISIWNLLVKGYIIYCYKLCISHSVQCKNIWLQFIACHLTCH